MVRLLSALLALLLAAGPALAGSDNTSYYNADYFTNLPVVTHNGETVHFYDDLIKGKKVVINFAYLNCNDICPLATSRMAEVKRRLGDAVGKDVFFYTITMDPKRDTPELLKMYADAFDAGPGWLFLTGDPADIDAIRHKLGDRARKLSEHRNDVILGNDVEGDWARSSTFADMNVLVATIRELDPAYRAQVHQSGGDKARGETVTLKDRPGEALYMKACSTCHTIGHGKLVGPDLAGVTGRRERTWLERFLASPARMLREHDPIMTELAEAYKGVRMPELGLQPDDIADLLHYIDERTAKSEARSGADGADQSTQVHHPHG